MDKARSKESDWWKLRTKIEPSACQTIKSWPELGAFSQIASFKDQLYEAFCEKLVSAHHYKHHKQIFVILTSIIVWTGPLLIYSQGQVVTKAFRLNDG